jgi:uncharacterized membrane protein HdeD (DUF308 family)
MAAENERHRVDKLVQRIWGEIVAPALTVLIGAVTLLIVAPLNWNANRSVALALVIVGALLVALGVAYFIFVAGIRRKRRNH